MNPLYRDGLPMNPCCMQIAGPQPHLGVSNSGELCGIRLETTP